MATIFEIFIEDSDKEKSQYAAFEAFKLLDLLEIDLSRFIENSDVNRINKLEMGQETIVSPETFECLQISTDIFLLTQGCFDITAGALVDKWRKKYKEGIPLVYDEIERLAHTLGKKHFELDSKRFAVRKISGHKVELDLGGIGKGFAVDKMSELLQEWDIHSAFIHGGQSSIFALGAPSFQSEGWPVSLIPPGNGPSTLDKICLKNASISGSGLLKGEHILDLRTLQPVAAKSASWVVAPNAALSDALSTAFLILDSDEIKRVCEDQKEISALILKEEKTEKFGNYFN